jgi:hypothetical protein
MYLQYYSDNPIQIGKDQGKLSIGCSPSAYQFDVNGAGRFSYFCSANNYITTSDRRIKTDIEFADPDECLRLVSAVKPRTYKRLDMNLAPRLGYVAQEWDAQLTGGYRCIMGAGEDENGPLLALDYSRICPVIHGALLGVMSKLEAALARIEALESRA